VHAPACERCADHQFEKIEPPTLDDTAWATQAAKDANTGTTPAEMWRNFLILSDRYPRCLVRQSLERERIQRSEPPAPGETAREG
jgi:hypothetical protein